MVDAPGRLTLWGIEVFSAVAEERSVSAAARRLDASPSAISQQLSNLEAALGTALVDRSARPLALTTAGNLFRRRAEAILNETAAARSELRSRDLARLLRFNLGIIEDFDSEVTPLFLSQMGDTLKGTRFLLETRASHRLHDLLEARALDMIVATEVASRAEWMEVHPLLEEPFIAVLPKGTAKGGADVLSKLPFIQYTQRHIMGRQIAEHLASEGLNVESRFEIDSYRSILSMVAGGAGWSILTPLGVMSVRTALDQVDLAPLPGKEMSRRISLIARQGTLYDMPSTVAERLRPLLRDLIATPSKERMPWLGDRLRVL